MSVTVISKGNKRRHLAKYTWEGKQLSSDKRSFEMVIERLPAGYKKKNGKPAMTSRTVHRIVGY